MMPRLDGFGLLRALRADAALRGIPVIMLSARAGQDEAAMGLDTGANDYIAKPFSARELLVRVASHLAAARAAREMAEFERTQRANLYRHFMQAPFPVAVFKGPSHRIELANPSVLAALACGPEIIGSPFAEAIPAMKDQPFLALLDGVLRTGVTYEGRETLARLPSGPGGELKDAYYDFVYAPLRDGQGLVEGVLLSAFDVTAQVLARQATERSVVLPTAVLRTDSSRAGHGSGREAAETQARPLNCPPALAGLRIVVVDDEAESRELLRFVLEQAKSDVTVANDAGEALAAVREGAFDILVSDIGMPGGDGYALIRSVRALPTKRGRLIPAIALTAYARSEDRTAALMTAIPRLRAGFDMHLTKPVEPAELLVVIATLAEGVRLRRSGGG